MDTFDVIVVGGGMAGLACATKLNEHGIQPLVLEASNGVGGRVRTDVHDGFLLDRGFQVLLTAYPEAQRCFDYDALQLARFEPGALVHLDGSFHRVSDPFRRPEQLFATLRSPIGSMIDKIRVADVRRRVRQGDLDQLFERPQSTTRDYLQRAGLSESIIDRFFRAFLGGIFLERELATSSRMFEFVFRMFSEGDAVLPAQGMGELAKQLVEPLPDGSVRTACRVAEVEESAVTLDSGERLEAEAIVMATPPGETARLLGGDADGEGHGVTCLYFSAPEPPLAEAILVLDGTGRGPVNNMCVPSQVSPTYAPEGAALVSATVLGEPDLHDADLERGVRTQLQGWFGAQVEAWEHLRTYRIRYALPVQTPEALPSPALDPRLERGLYQCGDHCQTGSLQGALHSGRRAAEAVMEDSRES